MDRHGKSGKVQDRWEREDLPGRSVRCGGMREGKVSHAGMEKVKFGEKRREDHRGDKDW